MGILYLVTTHRHSMLQQQGSAVADERVILSDIFGYISFGCWLFVLLPQLYLNYQRKSSDGLSLGFIFMWLAGDFTDWYGAYVGRLLLPAILIALYFVVTDIVLLAQMFCYQKTDDDIFGPNQLPEGAEQPPLMVRRGRRACRFSGPERAKQRLAEYREAERAALLDRGIVPAITPAAALDDNMRSFDATIASYGATDDVSRAPLYRSQIHSMWESVRTASAHTTIRAIFVSTLVLTLLLGFGIGSRIILDCYPPHITNIVSQVFGYISAAMFFVAYIPQIAWNFTAQSTEGLSAGMFVFTVLGNVTYCLSILAISTERDYLVAYAPWLAGAAGTLGFETLVLWQCYFYGNNPDEEDAATVASGMAAADTVDEVTDAISIFSQEDDQDADISVVETTTNASGSEDGDVKRLRPPANRDNGHRRRSRRRRRRRRRRSIVFSGEQLSRSKSNTSQ